MFDYLLASASAVFVWWSSTAAITPPFEGRMPPRDLEDLRAHLKSL